METFSALLALCAGNSPVTGEFPSQKAVTRSFDVFFDLRLNKWLSKQSIRHWFETPWRSLWRHGNDLQAIVYSYQIKPFGLHSHAIVHTICKHVCSPRFNFRPLAIYDLYQCHSDCQCSISHKLSCWRFKLIFILTITVIYSNYLII